MLAITAYLCSVFFLNFFRKKKEEDKTAEPLKTERIFLFPHDEIKGSARRERPWSLRGRSVLWERPKGQDHPTERPCLRGVIWTPFFLLYWPTQHGRSPIAHSPLLGRAPSVAPL